MNSTTFLPDVTIIKRLGLFLFITLPGALLTAACGAALGAAIVFREVTWATYNVVTLMLLGGALLLFGTRTASKPLFLLVFLPMPIFVSLGCYLGYLGNDLGLAIMLAAMVAPVITCPSISRFYKRRAMKVSLHPATPTAPVAVVEDNLVENV